MAGARTQLYNFFVAMVVLFTILFLDSLFYHLPTVVLASIIIVAAIGTFPNLSSDTCYSDLFILTTFPCTRPSRI